MTTTSPLQFGRDLPSAPTRVVPIPKGKLRVLLLILITKRKRVLFVFLLLEEIQCESILTLSKANSG